jgi:Bacterial Ig-like domain (group 3)
MSKRLFARATVVLATALLGGSVLVGIASPAMAASLGPVTLAPNTSGLVTDNPMFASGTTGPCPTGFGENANLRIGRPGGPYSNLAPALGGGGFDTAPITINPNRSFQTALGGTAPGSGEWWVVMECYSLTEGRHVDEFRTVITVTGNSWTVKTATQTTTTLDITPASPVVTGDNVTLTAHVTPASAGNVDFIRSTSTVIGSAPTDAAGNASLSTTALPIGTHEIKAVFRSADPANVLNSESAPQSYVVNPRTGGDSELVTISANVGQGAFTIDVASNATSLTGGSVGGSATGSLPQATVTDLRGTNVGWNVTGDLTDFANGSSTITNTNLSWTPSTAKVSGSGTATAGVSAALGQTRTLCSAASGGSSGVFHCDAGLNLTIPDTASPGEYTATLTLTLA